MLNVGVIGIGNTGNQVASLAKNKLHIPVLAINSSEKDLEVVPQDIPKKLIQNGSGFSQGAGKDRSLAKKYLKDSIMSLTGDKDIISMVAGDKDSGKDPLDVCFIISSTGGGTGSGTAIILADIMGQWFPDTKVILIGVLPVDNEGESSHVNTLQYLDELYKNLPDQTYILYDNDKLAGLPTYQILEKVNNEIVSDIDVLRCTFNYSTKYDSIDDRDMTRLISFPGRIMISRLEGFRERDTDSQSIEDMIIDSIKRNCHVEPQRDKKVVASGVITNLSQALTEEFDDNIPKVREFVGEPIHAFNHIAVNDEKKEPNNVFTIVTGLTPINDRITKISERIDEIRERQKVLAEESALASVDLEGLSDAIKDKEKDDTSGSLDIASIFSKYE